MNFYQCLKKFVLINFRQSFKTHFLIRIKVYKLLIVLAGSNYFKLEVHVNFMKDLIKKSYFQTSLIHH